MTAKKTAKITSTAYTDAQIQVFNIDGAVCIVSYGIKYNDVMELIKNTPFKDIQEIYVLCPDILNEKAVEATLVMLTRSGKNKQVVAAIEEYLAYHGLL